MRFLFWGALVVIVIVLARQRWQAVKRRWRGEPEPIQRGPRTVTQIVISIVIVYGVLLGYRLWTGG